MEKEKGIPSNWLADGVAWIANNKSLSVFVSLLLFLEAIVIIMVISFGYYMYTVSTTTPEMRMEILEDAFTQCLEMGIYPESCEDIAADAAGLANDD